MNTDWGELDTVPGALAGRVDDVVVSVADGTAIVTVWEREPVARSAAARLTKRALLELAGMLVSAARKLR